MAVTDTNNNALLSGDGDSYQCQPDAREELQLAPLCPADSFCEASRQETRPQLSTNTLQVTSMPQQEPCSSVSVPVEEHAVHQDCSCPIPCLAQELNKQVEEIEQRQQSWSHLGEAACSPREYYLPSIGSSSDVSLLAGGSRPLPSVIMKPWLLNNRAGDLQPAAPTLDAEPQPLPGGALLKKPVREVERVPSVPLALALRNYDRVAGGGAPLQTGAFRGCLKSAWCNRENRHRGLCNNRAAIPGPGAYSAEELQDAGLSPRRFAPAVTAPTVVEVMREGPAESEEVVVFNAPPASEEKHSEELVAQKYLPPPACQAEPLGLAGLELSQHMEEGEDSDGSENNSYQERQTATPRPWLPAGCAKPLRMISQDSFASTIMHSDSLGPSNVAQLLGNVSDYDDSSDTGSEEDYLLHSDVEEEGLTVSSSHKQRRVAGLTEEGVPRRVPSPTSTLMFGTITGDAPPPAAAAAAAPAAEDDPALKPLASNANPTGVVRAGDEGGSGKGRKRAASGNAKFSGTVLPGQQCTQCLTQVTPVWRAGPYGPKTLCNACGVRWMKSSKRPGR